LIDSNQQYLDWLFLNLKLIGVSKKKNNHAMTERGSFLDTWNLDWKILSSKNFQLWHCDKATWFFSQH
jgi:hypothetical protein